MKNILILALVAALTVPAAALAEDPPDGGGKGGIDAAPVVVLVQPVAVVTSACGHNGDFTAGWVDIRATVLPGNAGTTRLKATAAAGPGGAMIDDRVLSPGQPLNGDGPELRDVLIYTPGQAATWTYAYGSTMSGSADITLQAATTYDGTTPPMEMLGAPVTVNVAINCPKLAPPINSAIPPLTNIPTIPTTPVIPTTLGTPVPDMTMPGIDGKGGTDTMTVMAALPPLRLKLFKPQLKGQVVTVPVSVFNAAGPVMVQLVLNHQVLPKHYLIVGRSGGGGATLTVKLNKKVRGMLCFGAVTAGESSRVAATGPCIRK
jgi:hypothetical protein